MTPLARLLVLVVALVVIGLARKGPPTVLHQGEPRLVLETFVPALHEEAVLGTGDCNLRTVAGGGHCVRGDKGDRPEYRDEVSGRSAELARQSALPIPSRFAHGGIIAAPAASPSPTGQVAPTSDASDVTWQGIASHMGSAPVPAWYLAIPKGPGYRVRLCGPVRCIDVTSTDAGPSLAMQRAGRVADLSVALFERVCDCPSSVGLINVSVTIERRAVLPTLPPTDGS